MQKESEQVKQSNLSQMEFVDVVAHELRIPMTNIKGYSKLLQIGAGGPLSEQQQAFIEVIANNVERMTGLIDDLLEISRIEAGRVRLDIQEVQLDEVIDEVIERVQPKIEGKSLTLQVNLADNLPALQADPKRLVQIMIHLLSNAYKYTASGGTITISAQPTAETPANVAVTIADTGYGMSPADQAQLFTLFFRSDDQNIRDEPGAGLGLFIVKKLVELQNGGLTVSSELEKGSAFTFTVPAANNV